MFATQNRASQQQSVELRPFDRLTLAFIGVGVIFACLGMGEAVYRLLFFEFDGATDRLPIEMAFGLAFAFVATKLARRIYQHRLEASARINTVWIAITKYATRSRRSHRCRILHISRRSA